MPTPEPSCAGSTSRPTRLPFLTPALRRFLEELPAPRNGLSRTEATALSAIAGRDRKRASDLFRRTIAAEEAAFMGDVSFFPMLHDLAVAETPLIAGLELLSAPVDDAARYGAPAGPDRGRPRGARRREPTIVAPQRHRPLVGGNPAEGPHHLALRPRRDAG